MFAASLPPHSVTEQVSPRIRRQKKDHEKMLEEIIVENFPKMGKEIKTQVHETQRVLNRMNSGETPQDTY